MLNNFISRALVPACATLFVVAGTLVITSRTVVAEDGAVTLEIYKAGFIAGVSGGSGTLTFKGKRHPLTIGGVSLGATIGISKAELIGDVINLKSVADIAGTYSATQAGLAIAGGEKVAHLKNSKGVEIKVRGQQIGVELSLDLSGLQIELAK